MKQIIYADNAATTELDMIAFEAMKPLLLNEYGNASQPYSFGRSARQAVKEARQQIAACIGAQEHEVFFTSCGTESDNWVLNCFSNCESKKLIITSCIEHHAILKPCEAMPRSTKVVQLPVNRLGEISCNDLEKTLERELNHADYSGNVLVSIMYANNEIGTIQPIKELSQIAHSHGALFHTDAVQAVGHVSIDVKDLDVDFLSASAHKFNGPKGIGFLFVKQGIPFHPMIYGGAQESKMRAGTENVASIVGMSVALKNNTDEIAKNADSIHNLEKRLIERIEEANLDFVRNGSLNHVPGNVNLSFKNSDGEMILHRLDLKGICISTGSACDSINTQVSHVIKAIGVPDDYSRGTIRVSLGKNNTLEEIDAIADAIISIFKRNRVINADMT